MPGPGVVVATETETRAVHVRQAVNVVRAALANARGWSAAAGTLFDSRWSWGCAEASAEPSTQRAAWALIGVWLVGRASGSILGGATLKDGETWFVGGDRARLPSLAALVDGDADRRACRALEHIRFDEDFRDLLPYILDSHGPGSRLSVMKDPDTRAARAAKRETGVFYSPADVAEYIAAETMKGCGRTTEGARCLDPACGSGVFLKAVLRRAQTRSRDLDRFVFAQRNLFGLDVSLLAVEASVFVLLMECMADAARHGLSAWRAWHALRLNFAALDTLTISVVDGVPWDEKARAALRIRMNCPHGEPPMPAVPRKAHAGGPLFGRNERPTLGRVFPELAAGAEMLIGNPPYADIGRRNDDEELAAEFTSLRGNQTAASQNLYPLFIEMMWRLTRPGRSAAGLVVPLSIAYHSGGQFTACRSGIMQSGGRWRFAFFDREPHALFGEDVKTRNAIVFRQENRRQPSRDAAAAIETGPLRKWTSRSRDRLFDSIAFTPLEDADVTSGIPKLMGPAQAHSLAVLAHRKERFGDTWLSASSCAPEESFDRNGAPRVFVASTAYNFLNVFRPHQQRVEAPARLTKNPLLAMEFEGEPAAWRALAILSSRLVFWLWHVQGDGFHVQRGFIERLPFAESMFDGRQLAELAECGVRLWKMLQNHRIVSLNSGRETIAYRPLACECERDAIDALLLRAAGLDKAFAIELRDFVRATVTVDQTDGRRTHLLKHFTTTELSA